MGIIILESRAMCVKCNTVESMNHILAECSNPGQKEVWELARQLWAKRSDHEISPSIGTILGCGLANFTHDGKPNTGKNRLYKIIISESAYLIWKLRGKTHSIAEIHNRWVGTMNQRLAMDCILTNKNAYGKKALKGKTVTQTWSNCILNEKDLPQDWYRTKGVLVGITTRRPQGRNR